MSDDRPTRTYRYRIDGTDVLGQAWEVTGYVDCLAGECMQKVPEVAGAEAFMQLTQGKAVFGKPGLTCKGPYRFLAFEFEDVTR